MKGKGRDAPFDGASPNARLSRSAPKMRVRLLCSGHLSPVADVDLATSPRVRVFLTLAQIGDNPPVRKSFPSFPLVMVGGTCPQSLTDEIEEGGSVPDLHVSKL